MPEDEVLRSEEPVVEEPVAEPEPEPAIEYEMELEDGTVVACDQYGNPIEAQGEPEPAADPVAPATPATTEYHSPYTASALTEAEREKVGFTPDQMQAIEQMFERRLAQDRVAYAQQSRAARELGLSDDAFAQMSPYMDQAAAIVPKELKGTKQGAAMQVFGAMALDAEQNGFDIGKTLAKYGAAKPVEAPKPVVREAIPPSARTTTPRPAPSSVRPAKRSGADSVAVRAVGGDEVMDIIRRERKVMRGY